MVMYFPKGKLIKDIVLNELDSAFVERGVLGVKTLKENGYSPISCEDNVALKYRLGKEHLISLMSNFIAEGSVYVPREGCFLTRNSVVLKSPLWAQDSSECDFKTVKNFLKDSLHVPYGKTEIKTAELTNNQIALFLFREAAGTTAEFLKDMGIKSIELEVDEMPPDNESFRMMLGGGYERDSFKILFGNSEIIRDARKLAEKYFTFISENLLRDLTIRPAILQNHKGDKPFDEAVQRYIDIEWGRKDEAIALAMESRDIYTRQIDWLKSISTPIQTRTPAEGESSCETKLACTITSEGLSRKPLQLEGGMRK